MTFSFVINPRNRLLSNFREYTIELHLQIVTYFSQCLKAFETRIVSGSKRQSKAVGASSWLISWILQTICREVKLGIASDCRSVKNFKTERTNDSDKLIIYDMVIPTSLFPKTSTHRRPQVTAVDVVNIYIHWLAGPFRSQLSLILEILAITLAKLGLVAALKLSPVGRG